MKRFAVLGIIVALLISFAAIGCSSGSSEPKSTQTAVPTVTESPTQTVAPTPTATEEPENVKGLPANYKFFLEWSDSDGNSGEMQYWAQGAKWRTDWDATQDGTKSELLMIYDGQFAYLYMPDMPDQVYKYTTSWATANPGTAYAQEFKDGYWGEASDSTILAGFQAACAGTASIEGQEDVSGQYCTKFTCDLADGSVSHYWISDSGWLVKGEVTSAEGYTYTMQYSNIGFNTNIADSIFDINTIAPGASITEM